jgi:hypothetical protein
MKYLKDKHGFDAHARLTVADMKDLKDKHNSASTLRAGAHGFEYAERIGVTEINPNSLPTRPTRTNIITPGFSGPTHPSSGDDGARMWDGNTAEFEHSVRRSRSAVGAVGLGGEDAEIVRRSLFSMSTKVMISLFLSVLCSLLSALYSLSYQSVNT